MRRESGCLPHPRSCSPHLATHPCVLSHSQMKHAAAFPLPEPAVQLRKAKERRWCMRATVWTTLAAALLCGALLLLSGDLDTQAPSTARPERHSGRCTARNASSDLLASVLAPGFEEWAVSLVETLSEPDVAGAMTQEKAHVGALPPRVCSEVSSLTPSSSVAVLMASPLDVRMPSTATLDAALRAAFPGCSGPPAPRCMVSHDAATDSPHDIAQRRGELQAWVVDALRQCPHGGLIVIHNIHRMSPAALPALLPLLSEAGQYTSRGEAVPAWPATVALTAQLRGLDACGSVAACQRRAKASLHDHLLGDLEAREGDEARVNLAGAFRRRIDDVALLRVVASS
jgi:hypothetical protein